GPREPRRDAGLFRALRDLARIARRSEVDAHLFRALDVEGPVLAFRDLHRDAADDARELALEVADAGFARVAVDDRLDRFALDLELLLLDAVLLELLRDQVIDRDVELLAPRIAGDLDDLHAVPERRRD